MVTQQTKTTRRVAWALALAAIAMIVPSTAFLPQSGASNSKDSLPTHVVTCGDLVVSVTEQGTLESANNTEIKCKVRGQSNTVIWVVENGTEVNDGDELVRLETLLIEEEINERIKFFHLARAAAARSKADVREGRVGNLGVSRRAVCYGTSGSEEKPCGCRIEIAERPRHARLCQDDGGKRVC